MPVPTLARLEDLKLRASRVPDEKLLLALVRASNRFRGAVHHPVHQVLGVRRVLDGTGTKTLFLPAVPVTRIESVRVDGELITDWKASAPSTGMIRRDAGWPEDSVVEVVFDSGWPEDEIPGDIQDAVLEAAENSLPASYLVQETAGGRSLSYGAAATTGVTEKWAQAVAAHRIDGRTTK